MANYYRNEIRKANDAETLNNIISELDYAGLPQLEYFELWDEATEKLAQVLTW